MRIYSAVLCAVLVCMASFVEEKPQLDLRTVPKGSVVGAAIVVENRSAYEAWRLNDICQLFEGETVQYMSGNEEYVRVFKTNPERTENRQGCQPGVPIDLYKRIWDDLEKNQIPK